MTLNELLATAQELLAQHPHLGNREVVVEDSGKHCGLRKLTHVAKGGFAFDDDGYPSRQVDLDELPDHPNAKLCVSLEYNS